MQLGVDQLYSLYCAGHAEARRVSDDGLLRAFELSVDGTGITALERLILELALHDATNGTAMRSPEGFRRALEQGADLLGGLGFRMDEKEAPAPSNTASAPLLEEAA